MIKRSVVVQGHATSVRLEPEFWQFIDSYCLAHDTSLSKLIITIEKQQKEPGNLASQLRIFCLKQAMREEG